jgi:malic enzyme
LNKIKEDAINLHRALRGKIEIHNRVSIDVTFDEEKGTLGLIYTPGVAAVAEEISKNKELIYDYTSKWNNVATARLRGLVTIALILRFSILTDLARSAISSLPAIVSGRSPES